MKRNDTLHPLWRGFLDLVGSIFVIEAGFCLYLVVAGELLP
jgi:hypothetical protein